MQRQTNDIPAHDIPASGAVVIMGVSGSGKSTLASLLAAQLDRPFLEGDSYHSPASVAKMRSGIPLQDDDRWPWLDRLGAAIGSAVGAEGMSVTACSALRRCYRDRLRAAIKAPVSFVLLDTDREELARRMTNRPGHYMPAVLLDSQLAILERPDLDEQALALDGRRPPEALAEAVMDWLNQAEPAARRAV